jgi:hypothetical protein
MSNVGKIHFVTARLRFATIFGTLAALIAGVLVTGLQTSPATAAGGTGTWGAWSLNGRTGGSLNLNVGGFTSPSADFTTNANGLSAPSGTNAWLNDGTGPGARYGTSRGTGYLSMGTAAGGADSVTTFTFTGTTPTTGWSFALGDIDADAVTISATDATGAIVDPSTWSVTPFNYCNNSSPRPTTCSGVSSDLPSWNSTTQTVTGSGNDTDGASAWVQPNAGIKTLTLRFKKLIGFPTYQLWFAGDTVAEQNYKVTLAARSCPTFTDIMANRSRNNIMESLQNVGIDSIYTRAPFTGAVRPEVEDAAASGQSACAPLSGWAFAMGTGINGKDSGSYGSLSKVRSPLQTATTQEATPELDAFGNDTGRSLAGAVTYNLTASQVASLANRSVWVQGGTPGSPLNGRSDLAFGTLRCAVDNANADNVEWIGVTGTQRHMFCYAYYVDTAEKSGTIIIRKSVPSGAAGVSFGFGGDVSFSPGGAFSLNAGGSQNFIRAAGETWRVSENNPAAPFELTDITCASSNSLSNITKDLATREVAITLGVADTVTCTYKNEAKPKAGLTIYKVANGATGTFGFSVDQGLANKFAGNVSVTETGTDTSVTNLTGLAPGAYTVTETSLPNTPGGTWDKPSISCVDSTGSAVSVSDTVLTGASLTLNGNDTECTVVNNFIPNAKINIINKIVGGSGSISAGSTFVATNSMSRSETSDTLINTAWGEGGKQAAQETGLPFGDYTITGTAPIDTTTSAWSLDSLDCSGGSNFDIQDTSVSLALDSSSTSATEITCTYVWRLTALANVTINKISEGDVGTFTLTGEIDGQVNSGEVTTESTGVAAQALSYESLPEGSTVTLGEIDMPVAADGQWNADNGGSPTWVCVDSASNPVAISDANQITSTNLDVTCTATNTFTVDPNPTPSETPDPRISETGEVVYKYNTLPKTGGALPAKSFWARTWQTIKGLFS